MNFEVTCYFVYDLQYVLSILFFRISFLGFFASTYTSNNA